MYFLKLKIQTVNPVFNLLTGCEIAYLKYVNKFKMVEH